MSTNPDEMNLIERAYAKIDKMPEYPTVAESTEQLWEMMEDHVELLEELTASKVEESPVLDAVVIAALLRSHATVLGFLSMIEERNKYCAVAMTRFQLDSTMRLFACTLAEDPLQFVGHILGGGMPGKYKTKDGRFMTDKLLHTELSNAYPGTSDAYEDTSGFVHLSNRHLAGVFDARKSKPGRLVFSDPTSLVYWDEPQVQAAMVRFIWATSCLLDLCFSLHELKDRPSPERLNEMR
jgi:hypothetical protein